MRYAFFDEHRPSTRVRSIRHIASGNKGVILIGMQWEGNPSIIMPNIGFFSGGKLELLANSAAHCGNNVGSVEANGKVGIVTAPKSIHFGRFREKIDDVRDEY